MGSMETWQVYVIEKGQKDGADHAVCEFLPFQRAVSYVTTG